MTAKEKELYVELSNLNVELIRAYNLAMECLAHIRQKDPRWFARLHGIEPADTFIDKKIPARIAAAKARELEYTKLLEEEK